MKRVLIIGESSNRQRMGLSGYDRDTTRRLDALQEEMLVFDHVYAPGPCTTEALEQVLTVAGALQPDLLLHKPAMINR